MKDINRKDYIDAMESVHASEALTDRVKNLAQSVEQTKKLTGRNVRRYSVAAAAMVVAAAIFSLVFFVPDTSVAKYVKKMFSGFWSGQKEVEPYVQKDVYQDEDRHVKISVEEVLSDEVCIQMVVKYTAKDKTGENWLRDYAPNRYIDREDGKSLLNMEPEGLGGFSGGVEELEEYHSEKEQYYSLFYGASEWTMAADKMILRYPLPTKTKEMIIDTSSCVPVYEYTLKAEKQKKLSEYYEPKRIRLSKLSLVIYGKDTGMFDTSYSLDKTFSEDEKEGMQALKLIKKDGSKQNIDFFASGGSIGEETEKANPGCDCLVVSCQLYRMTYNLDDEFLYDENYQPKIKKDITKIALEEIVGVELTNGKGSVVYHIQK